LIKNGFLPCLGANDVYNETMIKSAFCHRPKVAPKKKSQVALLVRGMVLRTRLFHFFWPNSLMPRLGTVWLAVLVIAFAFAAFPCQAQNSTLRFSEQPTEQEIFKARVFDEPLLPIGGEPRPEENKALADAMSAYAGRTTFDDPSSFNDFLGRFPASPWTGSLLLHLGVEYYHYGYYSKALDAWEQAWQILQNSTDSKGKLQADRSLGELARMYSKLGRMDELRSLLTSVAGRPLRGPATTMIGCATQALWMMDHRPGSCFKCGPFALNSILAETDRMKAANPLIIYAQSTTNGYSLPQLARLSLDVGMHYQMAFRSPSAPWIVPAVIHWKVGHYAALLRKDGNSFLVKDRTFINTLEMSPEALEEEGSGYFLVPPGPLPNGWRAVSEIEGQHVWTRHHSSRNRTQCGASWGKRFRWCHVSGKSSKPIRTWNAGRCQRHR
jgi:hypothetical protein